MLTKSVFLRAVSGGRAPRRWVQGSPIRPDVWFDYALGRGSAISVLLTPHRRVTPGRLFAALGGGVRRGYNGSVVVVDINFENLLRRVLPLSSWWDENCGELLAGGKAFCSRPGSAALSSDHYYFLRAVGLILQLSGGDSEPTEAEVISCCSDAVGLVESALDVLNEIRPAPAGARGRLFAVSKNRLAQVSSRKSRETIKADAATRVFDLGFKSLTWAVLDTGIESTHPAFGHPGTEVDGDAIPLAASRVVASYDFTRLRRIMELASSPSEGDRELLEAEFGLDADDARDLGRRISAGLDVDWPLLQRALLIDDPSVETPGHPHGTHVAGILGGRGGVAPDDGGDDASAGVCPDIRLIDIRVLDGKGNGDEFQIIAALQFVRHLNSSSKRPVVQGVNLSLQMLHDVQEYACGRTPVCDESERLVSSGVVVVAAAGNRGFSATGPAVGFVDNPLGGQDVGGYEDISITDPGNAEAVITVGATHRSDPHTYGVSYFSSRGPTGDGRVKPDLLAPGEKIPGPVLEGEYDMMDGTSQAAPHVSGAAAMLMARNPELIGRPAEIKTILMEAATNLGRKQEFQGQGLVDILRALQSR